LNLAQKTRSLAFLNREVAVRKGRAASESSTDPQVQAEIAEQLLTADALAATYALVEHYQPVDNSGAETQRIEVAS
jgi:ABC-type hemin transport system ATPase subunit